MNITIGADPEILLLDPVSGSFVPVIGLLGGTKREPKRTRYGYVQEDNVMAEFCIPPAGNSGELYSNISLVLNDIRELLPNLAFSESPSAYFDPALLTHPQAKEAGCEPDFNAWVEPGTPSFKNPRPPVVNGTLRTAGGHVHVGFALPTEKRAAIDARSALVRALDVTLGLPSILMDRDTERRKLYGRAGAHRPKPYGVEYRVLSNFWIWKEEFISWVWRGVEHAIDLSNNSMTAINNFGERIQEAINTSNEKECRRIISHFDVEVV